MMARSHALSGAAAWLTGSAAAATLGYPPSGRVIVVGGIVCAGSAILPDWDCPTRDGVGGSHAARALGWPTQLIARGLAALSRTVYERTATPLDRPDTRRGHRGLTHTVPFAVGCGVVVSALAYTPAGRWVTTLVLFLTATWAARALLTNRTRHIRIGRRRRGHRRTRFEWPPAAAAVLATALSTAAPDGAGWWWLGVPVALGALIHDLGDTPAHHPDYPPESSGIPLLWPIVIRGQRWYRCRPPAAVMFPVDSGLERAWAWSFAVLTVASGFVLAAGW